MRRRTFMELALAGLATTTATGAAGQPSQAARIRCGVLGIDHAHALDALGVLRNLPEFDVVGVCEPDDAIRAQFSGNRALEGLPWLSEDQLLGDPSIRMVAVECFVPRLLEMGRAVVDAGKHLHLDKPAGTDLAAFGALLDAAESKDLLVQMGYMFRYNPGFDLVREAVREGWLGDVYSIHASICTSFDAEKRKRIAYHPGGLMLELGCHLIDIIVLLMGEPEKVTPFIRHDADFGDTLADNTLAVLEYPNAVVVVESAAMEPQAFGARRFKVVGSEGSLIVSPLEPPHARLALSKPHGKFSAGVTDVPLPDLERHVLDFQDFAACIRGEREFAYSKSHDFAVQRTVLRACGSEV